MSEQTARLVERLRTHLQRTIRRMTWADLAFGASVALGSLAAVWLIATVLEATFWLGTALRTGLVLLLATVVLGVGGAFVARPLARLLGLIDGPSEEEVARTVGQHHPKVADRLVNLLQLARGRGSQAPTPFVDRAVQHLAQHVDEASITDIVDRERVRRAVRLASLPLIGVLAFLLTAPSTFLDASERLLAPRTEFDPPAPFQLAVTPGDTRLLKGDSLRITVRGTGTVPGSATLLLRETEDAAPRRVALTTDSMGTFRHTVSSVRRPLRYRVVASPIRTDWYSVEVTNRPLVRRLHLTVEPPAYTGLPTRQLDPNVGDVSALPGARVNVSGILGGANVTEAYLDFQHGPNQSLRVTGDSLSGSFVLRRADTYVVRLQSQNGVANREPIRYKISPQSDARPSASFLEPDGTAELTPDLTQQLRVQLGDDYGFRRAVLFYRPTDPQGQAADSSFDSLALPLQDPEQLDQQITHTWLLAQESGLPLERGDAVDYYVKVWDNDTVNGPKSGRTRTQRLRFPSLSEQYEQLDETQEETSSQMEELQRESESVRQQFQELRDELRRTREADWEDRRQLEDLRQQQESVNKGVEELSRQVEELNREMQRNDLSSPETMQKFEELRQTIDEIQSPELQKALDQLRQSMQENNFRRMQQSLENAESRQEQFQQRLERTLNLFKQLKTRQKLEEMSRRAQDLSEQEQRLAEKTGERMQQQADADSSDRAQNEARTSDSTSTDSTAAPSDADTPPDSTAASRRSNDNQPSDSTATGRSSSDSTAAGQRSPADSTANDDLAREQEKAAQQMQELMDTMEEAQQEMQDVPSAPREQMRKLNKQLREQNLPQQMQQNSKQLRQNQLQPARQQQQQMQKRLQKTQSRLSKMQQQMQSQQRMMNLTGLRSVLENTLRLSKNQEDLRSTIQNLAAEGPTLRQYAQDQKTLADGLETVADSLHSIASRVPEMSRTVQRETGNALRAMRNATNALDEREGSRATGHQKTSMMHLNELALLLSDLLNQMQQQGGGGGMSAQQMMQQLQQTSGQQQKLNKQIQNFLNQVQGDRLSPNMKNRRQQLARQQRQIKQQLEEMDVGSETKEQILGDLEKIAEQMEQSAEELQQGERSRDLMERQQQILTRLLNAQQSLRTQGKQQERQGRRADDDFERQPPEDQLPQEKEDTLRRDLIRSLEMGYSSDYETLIKRYFELLQQERGPTNE